MTATPANVSSAGNAPPAPAAAQPLPSEGGKGLTRRDWLSRSAATLGGAIAISVTGSNLSARAAAPANGPSPAGLSWRYCLNTSTIRGQELGLVEEIAIAAKAGYTGIEPWIREIEAYQRDGGRLDDLRKRIADSGLTVESAIGFAQWAGDDAGQRAAGLEQAKRDMDLVRALGGKRIAAPPAGVTGQKIALGDLAERYRTLLELGASMEVTPQVEVWGPSQTLGKLAEAVYVAVASGHNDACLLPDVYHLFRGGSSFAGLKLLHGSSMHCFHINDYPAEPAREAMTDADRVHPGDGVAPLGEIFRTLQEIGYSGALSLELFNRGYWQQDALEVARTGLQKMQAAVAKALE